MSASTPPLSAAWATDSDIFSPTTDMYFLPTGALSPAATSVSSITTTSLASDDHDDRHAASVALRRQRNRESMRRTRQRAKDTLTELRGTLERLEAQYARLLAAPEPSDADAHAVDRRAFVERLQARLLALVQMRRTLESENGAVRAQIQQRQALERELQQILDENALDEMVNEKLALLGGTDVVQTRDGFTPLSLAQAHEFVHAFCHELAGIRAAASAVDESTPLEVFGWRTRRHVDAATNEMHFEFIKQFDHITAWEMTQRAWVQAMDTAQYRANERELNIRRLEVLQHISNDVKVMLRDTVHASDPTVFRAIFVIFKIPIPSGGSNPCGDGVLVGMRSINPPPDVNEPAPHDGQERVVWIDVAISVELMPCGPRACRVHWRGRTNYKSPQYAAENAVKFLMGLLRWEQAILGPMIELF